MKPLTAIELAEELFKIHHHYDELTNKEIYYKEVDIIALFKKLGYPEPDFDGYGNKAERELLSCPGDTIIETLKATNISVRKFRHRMNNSDDYEKYWTADDIDRLLKGDLEINDKIAADLERVLGVPKQFWLNREKHYREKLAKLEGQ